MITTVWSDTILYMMRTAMYEIRNMPSKSISDCIVQSKYNDVRFMTKGQLRYFVKSNKPFSFIDKHVREWTEKENLLAQKVNYAKFRLKFVLN